MCHVYAKEAKKEKTVFKFNPGTVSSQSKIALVVLHLSEHAHLESEEFFRLTGQLAQPNQEGP